LWPVLAPLLQWEAYAQLADSRIGGVFWRTVWMSGLSTALACAVGLPLALLAYRTRIFGAELLALLTPLTLLLPPLLMAQGWNGFTGWDGLWASVFTMGMVYAPLPALFAARALTAQAASGHESAWLLGGPRFAAREMALAARPGLALGGALCFVLCANDFAVPDYYGALGETFGIYPGHIYNHFRDDDYWAGARAASPLVLFGALMFYLGLSLRDRWTAPQESAGRPIQRLPLQGTRAAWSTFAWVLLFGVLLLPLARVVYELGVAGPLAPGSWGSRAGESVQAAIERGREDVLRSLKHGALAATVALVLAPLLAFALARKTGRAARILSTLVAVPLLVPGVAYGMGAIAFANRPGWTEFYQGSGLVVWVFAGRFLAIAVFILTERFQRIPRSRDEAAILAGWSFPRRLIQVYLAPQWSAWCFAGGLVMVFAVRELDLAILVPGANQSAAVRYFNALHFARDGFVAAFGLLIAIILFIPTMLYTAWRSLRND